MPRTCPHRNGRIKNRSAAVRTLRVATDDGRLDGAVVACVDESRAPLTLFMFDGLAPEDAVELAVDTIIEAAASMDSALGAIFLGSSRPGQEPGPTLADEARWRRMANRCADAGVDLLDWFLLADGAVCSVAEGLEPGPGW